MHTSAGNFAADEVLVVTGRRADASLLRLNPAAIVSNQRGQIVVDPEHRTTNPRVFAAGDVTPAPQFVYVAASTGAVAAENALTTASARSTTRPCHG